MVVMTSMPASFQPPHRSSPHRKKNPVFAQFHIKTLKMHGRSENSTLKRPWGGLGAAWGRPWAPPGPTLGPSVEKVFSKIGSGTSTWPKVPYSRRFCMVILWQPRPTGVGIPKLVDVIIVNGGHLAKTLSFYRFFSPQPKHFRAHVEESRR